ncbi:MAG: DUF1553 domain-containing protein [Cyclobacteriaceae bacterium]
MLIRSKNVAYVFSSLILLWLLVIVIRNVSIENKHLYVPGILLGEEVEFNRDIRPIINNKCIACHGGVKKSGEFSLLFEEEALAVNESGKRAIVPGSINKSELIHRINQDDPEQRMPLEGEPLTDHEKQLFTDWINQGAPWQDHWAYLPPQPKEVPESGGNWVSNEIDHFVYQKLSKRNIQPNPESDRYSLLRRVSFDLTGLPPTLEETDEFIKDTSYNSYENVVDLLLDSPAFGERWASMWMDLARYADSKGYEADRPRNIWKYRDWLIEAFNDNMPYDQFVTEQLAGDLLPDPTEKQLIATGFHRNTMNNDEGGTDNEEFRIAALIDRVNTTWTVMQGTTMECVQCHSHPYDPIRHEDYYKSMAFFNQTADADIPSESPVLVEFKDTVDIEKLNQLKSWVGDKVKDPELKSEMQNYFEKLVRISTPKIHPHYFEQLDKGIPVKGTSLFKVTDSIPSRTRQIPFDGEDRIMFKIRSDTSVGVLEFRLDHPEGEKIALWEVNRKTKTEFDEEEKKDKIYSVPEVISIPISPITGKRDLYLVLQEVGKAGTTLNLEWVMLHHSLPGREDAQYQEAEMMLYDLFNSEKEQETTPIMVELDDNYRRQTRVFEKGSWMVLGDTVAPGMPEKWNEFKDGYEKNRLGLAKWLFSPENPLTARVAVNRFWEQLFGRGLVFTMEDFGSQGFDPSHPELLDWLALRFVNEHQWDIKKLLKEMVMSSTYRQSSHFRDDLKDLDPYNEFLARGPRLRLKAEQIRDQALAVSGLLSNKMWGSSVMPEQPEGIWQVVYSGTEWKTSQGEDRYRRALYTFWRRTSPYPSIIAFDAPSREFCLPRRIDTNTPLQALVTLNDPVYLDAALALSRKVLGSSSKHWEDRLSLMYSMVMLRGIQEEKMEDLALLYENANLYFEQNPDAACQITGEEDNELAVYTVLANALMNLDEFLMKS